MKKSIVLGLTFSLIIISKMAIAQINSHTSRPSFPAPQFYLFQLAITSQSSHFNEKNLDQKEIPLQFGVGRRFLLNQSSDLELRLFSGFHLQFFEKEQGNYQNVNGDYPYLTEYKGRNLHLEAGPKLQLNQYLWQERLAISVGAGLSLNYESMKIETETQRSFTLFGNANTWDYKSSRTSARGLIFLGAKFKFTPKWGVFLNTQVSWLDPLSIKTSSDDDHLSRKSRYPGLDPSPFAYSSQTTRDTAAILGAEIYL